MYTSIPFFHPTLRLDSLSYRFVAISEDLKANLGYFGLILESNKSTTIIIIIFL